MKINTPFLIDTNILVYYFDEDSEFYSFSRSVIDLNPDSIHLASKSIAEFVCSQKKDFTTSLKMNWLIFR
jgi:hypothetical protein